MDITLYAILKNKITEIRQKLLNVVEDATDMNSSIEKNTNNIEKKLDKNQGASNPGKITGINESGDIVPMFPQGVTYNENTQCLEYGADEKLNLNAGIQLDDTLSKVGYAADAASVGELKSDIQLVVGTLGYVTPDMFGAVGDGATDDTQSFIKMLEANPKFINLKNKKYKVSSKLTVNFETRIEFGEIISDEIDYIIVIDSDNVVLDGIKLSNATYCGVYSHDCNNISIVNCTITNIRTEGEICRGIYLERCYNVTIENTTIGNIICPNDGVCIQLLDESDSKQIATGNVIKNCRFYNATKRHLKLQQGVTVENCDFKETEEVVCTNENISIYSSNIKVVGCNFNVDCPVIITLGAINTLYELFQNIVICNNVFNIYGHNYQGAITIPKGLVVDVKNVTIEDNIFNGFNNTKNTESALSIRSFVNNLHFSNNSINDLISAIDFWEATDEITPSYIAISNNIASVEENFIILKETTKLSKIFIGGNLLKYNSENYKNHPYIVRCVPSDAGYDYSASFEFGKNSTDDGITNYRVY